MKIVLPKKLYYNTIISDRLTEVRELMDIFLEKNIVIKVSERLQSSYK